MYEINVKELIEYQKDYIVIDVRSPLEFAQGHILGAKNIPLFSDEERADVGKRYKKINKQNATVQGLEYVAKSAKNYLNKIAELGNPEKVIVYCWRGGNRSLGFCKFLEACDITTYRLIGGYKSYRRYAREIIESVENLIVLSGFTGSGKTEKLIHLQNYGHQVIDLEGLANHYGSAFGSINRGEQPTTETFENHLFDKLNKFDFKKMIWVEDESRQIGKVHINDVFFKKMREAKVIRIFIDKKYRIQRLVELYSDTETIYLKTVFNKISGRLGLEKCREAEKYLEQSNYHNACEIALNYYDKAYSYGLQKRPAENIFELKLENDNLDDCVKNISTFFFDQKLKNI